MTYNIEILDENTEDAVKLQNSILEKFGDKVNTILYSDPEKCFDDIDAYSTNIIILDYFDPGIRDYIDNQVQKVNNYIKDIKVICLLKSEKKDLVNFNTDRNVHFLDEEDIKNGKINELLGTFLEQQPPKNKFAKANYYVMGISFVVVLLIVLLVYGSSL